MHNGQTTEEQQFSRLFQEEGIGRISDRLTVLRAFLSTEEHITSKKLGEMLAENGNTLEPEFVRETLRLLCRYGFALKREFKGRRSVYEHHHLGLHHDHMICVKCGDILEFMDNNLERMQAEVSASRGFHMLQHRMEIYGICAKCLEGRTRLQSLVLKKPGERVMIRDYTGGAGARQRLLAMGLRNGDELEVITNQGQGQVVVLADNKRFALGRGLAQKILVEAVNGDACAPQ